MSNQRTLAMAEDQGSGFARYAKPTRRDEFLKAMGALMPWSALCEEIAPHYPKAGNGRPPVGLERMLRMYFIQHWFNLADQACEEALYDRAVGRISEASCAMFDVAKHIERRRRMTPSAYAPYAAA